MEYIDKIGERIETRSLFIYLVIIYIIFSIGDILNHSHYLYPDIFKIISGVLILIISFVYLPIRNLYMNVLNFSILKKLSTYFWIVFIYMMFFYLNHLFFKSGFLMKGCLIIIIVLFDFHSGSIMNLSCISLHQEFCFQYGKS